MMTSYIIGTKFCLGITRSLMNSTIATRSGQRGARAREPLRSAQALGEHLAYEKLTPAQEAEYYALELRDNMSRRIKERFPRIHVVTGDCQKRLDFPDGHFDRILAIHVLEHLPDLPAAIREAYRVCDKDRGWFYVVIPCEGSLAYSLARRISAQRFFESVISNPTGRNQREHINRPHEILAES